MARPLKDGVDYFPLDTDFLQDDKVRLIKGEFGAKGILIMVALLCEIYRGDGYFKVWDNDCCILMADAVGCGIVPENITQVVQGCLRRSFFHEGVFQMFGILTSAGIQRRYIRMFPSRKQITIYREYWLLDEKDEKDVPAGILNKLTFKSLKNNDNPFKNSGNPDNNNFKTQSKGKESKVKKSISLDEKPSKKLTPIVDHFESRIRNVTGQDVEILNRLCLHFEEKDIKDAIDKAAEKGGGSAAYVESILKNPNRGKNTFGMQTGPDLTDPERYKNFGK